MWHNMGPLIPLHLQYKGNRSRLSLCQGRQLTLNTQHLFYKHFLGFILPAPTEKFFKQKRETQSALKHLRALAVTLITEFRLVLFPHISCFFFFFISSPLFLSDSLCSGETDERVLVPEPLRKADSSANQEDAGQDSQFSGEGQGVVRKDFFLKHFLFLEAAV